MKTVYLSRNNDGGIKLAKTNAAFAAQAGWGGFASAVLA